jgi:hypothetical protein
MRRTARQLVLLCLVSTVCVSLAASARERPERPERSSAGRGSSEPAPKGPDDNNGVGIGPGGVPALRDKLESAIADNADAIGDNADGIGDNADAIAENAADIAENATAIAENVAAIESLEDKTDANMMAIPESTRILADFADPIFAVVPMEVPVASLGEFPISEDFVGVGGSSTLVIMFNAECSADDGQVEVDVVVITDPIGVPMETIEASRVFCSDSNIESHSVVVPVVLNEGLYDVRIDARGTGEDGSDWFLGISSLVVIIDENSPSP